MTTLIKNGTVVTATDMTVADVLVDGERIQAIGTGLGGGAGPGGGWEVARAAGAAQGADRLR